jgi:hypothetical protein
MWPFTRKPVKTQEQIIAEQPPAPCGEHASHWEWEMFVGLGCPHCAGIRKRAQKRADMQRLADLTAEAVVRLLDERKA